MRKIKFRVKSELGKKDWEYVDILTDFRDNDIYMSYEDYDWKTLGEYIGLKDSKGKEIYEGDYIKDLYGNIGEVEFDDEVDTDGIYDYCSGWPIEVSGKEIEIIGNKYENSNLLK